MTHQVTFAEDYLDFDPDEAEAEVRSALPCEDLWQLNSAELAEAHENDLPFADELFSDAHISEMADLRDVCPDDYFDDPTEDEPTLAFTVTIDGDKIPVPMTYGDAATWLDLLQAKFPESTIGIVYA